MATAVIMPKLEMSQETARVVEWLKQEGQMVEKGDGLLTIETDKVTIDVECPGTGILAGVACHPGDVVPVTSTIAYLLQEGETLPDVSSATRPSPGNVDHSNQDEKKGNATPLAQRVASANGIDLSQVVGSGPAGKITRVDVSAKLVTRTTPETVQPALALKPRPDQVRMPVRATPAARRLAGERELDINSLSGSGPLGRVQARDVALAIPNTPPPGNLQEEIIPMEGMRFTIAERMQSSYQTAPHIFFSTRVDTTQMELVRQQLNNVAEGQKSVRVSFSSLLVKALAWALKQHPWLNSSLREDGIHLLKTINIGVAIALQDGLIVPVIRDTNEKSISQLASELKDKTERAQNGKLTLADVTGGTFTLSNLGPYGIEEFTSILNPGQSGILAVGAIQPEGVVVGDQLVIRKMMRITLSVDHRVVDGAVAAGFIASLKGALENPSLLLW